MRLAGLVLLVWSIATVSAQEPPPSFLVSRDVYLMGTRATLSIYAGTREAGLATLESALRTLEATEAELSTWRPSSAVSTLNRRPVGEPWLAAPGLCRTFAEVWRWHRATNGAFDPGVGRLLAAWDVHGNGRVPSASSLESALAASGLKRLEWNEARCTITRRADATMDVGAFGKGEALDRVASVLGAGPWLVDLGGQVSVGGRSPGDDAWAVAIADPRWRDRPVLEVRLSAGSLSTSAGSERDHVVGGRRVGHILDPRSGQPAAFTGSVTVWHQQGLAADALSTALFVMGPEEGLRWSESRNLAVLYLIPESGTLRVAATREFRALMTPGAASADGNERDLSLVGFDRFVGGHR